MTVPPVVAWIIDDRLDVARRRAPAHHRTARGRGECPLAQAPAIVFAAAGICRLLDIDLFARALPHVGDKHPSGRTIKAVAERITQPETKNFLARRRRGTGICIGVVWWDGGDPGRGIDVDAQHLAEQGRYVLCVAAGFDVAGRGWWRAGVLIVTVPTVAGADVEIMIVARRAD